MKDLMMNLDYTVFLEFFFFLAQLAWFGSTFRSSELDHISQIQVGRAKLV